jgi:NitT/TauT family transport system substrate-binding protein
MFAMALVLACALAWLVVGFVGWTRREEPQMRVGLVAVPEQEPLAVARTRGALDPARVLVVEFCSLEDLHNAFLDGNVHAGIFSLDEALRLTEPPTRARIERFVGTSRAPLSLITMSEEVRALADLRGRHVGLESGRRPMGALRELLVGGGLGLGDVQLQQLDEDAAPPALAQGRVDAALTYAPGSLRLVRAGAHTLARWEHPVEPELMVLVSTERAHRVAAGQLAHLAQAWLAGARALQQPDSAVTALIARREEIEPDEVGRELATQHFFSDAEERRLHEAGGLPVVEAALSAISARWRALGVPDTLPPRERWLVAAGKQP